MTEYCRYCSNEIEAAYLPGDHCEDCWALDANRAYPSRHTTMGDTLGSPEPTAPADKPVPVSLVKVKQSSRRISPALPR